MDKDPEYQPLHFYEEPIEVIYTQSPLLEKKPACPQAFEWRGQIYTIQDLLAEWHDYKRRGRFAKNMQPQHISIASKRGSWGVGVFYFRVRTDKGEIFDIYYDRAPKESGHRKGAWFVYRELIQSPD